MDEFPRLSRSQLFCDKQAFRNAERVQELRDALHANGIKLVIDFVKAYTIDNVETLLPEGEYVDFLGGMLNGENISVYASTGINTTASITLDGGEVGVWQYDAAANAPEIGNVVSTMGRAGNRVYIYGDGLDGNISVKFGETEATVESNTANEIVTYVPDNAVAGYNDITVTKGDAVSNSFT